MRPRTLFIGGPGRSGTSFVAACLARHPQVASFPEVELKFFTEKNGLLDLWHTIGEHYSPNRATVAVAQFRALTEALIDGRFGQPGLGRLRPAEAWRAIFDTFLDELSQDGHPMPHHVARFGTATADLVARVAELAGASAENGRLFVEKTPHALLAPEFLDMVTPRATMLHIMRDPRSVAHSLGRMSWGPDEPAACAAWVESYCDAWVIAEMRASRHGLPMLKMRIEEIAADPEAHGAWLCAALGLDLEPGLFGRADPATLNGWTARADAGELAVLDQRLACWIRRFGYDPDQVGVLAQAEAAAGGVARSA